MFRSLGIFLCSLALMSAEPSCSRFHYEEQTLRKMIMVEILVEKFKADIEETKGSVQDKLAEISTERAKSKHEIEEVMTRVTDMVNSLKEEQDIIQFSARGLKNKSPTKKETLIFTTIMSNNGSGYSKESGVFTAPVGGLYMFNLQLCIYKDRYLYFEIVVNEQTFFRGLALDDSSKWSSCNSYSISLVLKTQDTVMVQTGRTSGGALWEDDTEAWNILDGFLIQRN